MLKKALFLLMTLEMAVMAIPMESLNEYNLVLAHGADGSSKCFELITNDY
jgi:hypothetical protein